MTARSMLFLLEVGEAQGEAQHSAAVDAAGGGHNRMAAKENGGGRSGFAGRPKHRSTRRAGSACERETYGLAGSHSGSALRDRRWSTALVWIWQTRLSVTPTISPISASGSPS